MTVFMLILVYAGFVFSMIVPWAICVWELHKSFIDADKARDRLLNQEPSEKKP